MRLHVNLISGVNVAGFLKMLCSRKCEEACMTAELMVAWFSLGIPGMKLSDSRDWDTTFCNVVCKALHASHAEGGRT